MKKKIFVTGATRGLGNAIAKRLIADGYDVIGCARNPSNIGFPCEKLDISDAAAVENFFSAYRTDKDVYGLVNAAGIASMNLALSTPPETVARIIATNLTGMINVNREFGKLMVRRRNGRIVNFSTIAVAIALSGESVYVASKAGVEAFSRTFAKEMAGFNVTVNCIAPGPIDTDLIRAVPDEQIQKIIDQQVIKRKGTPEDVANIVTFLLSEKASMVTGQLIAVGGV